MGVFCGLSTKAETPQCDTLTDSGERMQGVSGFVAFAFSFDSETPTCILFIAPGPPISS